MITFRKEVCVKIILKQNVESGKRKSRARMAAASALLLCALGVFLSWGVTECFAAPTFYSTSDPTGHWYVSWKATGIDGNYDSSFKTASADFNQAVLANWRSDDFITNFSDGASDGISARIWNFTFFVFRQTFDLTGYDPATAILSFKWTADDSGHGGDQGNLVAEIHAEWRRLGIYTGPVIMCMMQFVTLSGLSGGFSFRPQHDRLLRGRQRCVRWWVTEREFHPFARESSAVPEPTHRCFFSALV